MKTKTENNILNILIALAVILMISFAVIIIIYYPEFFPNTIQDLSSTTSLDLFSNTSPELSFEEFATSEYLKFENEFDVIKPTTFAIAGEAEKQELVYHEFQNFSAMCYDDIFLNPEFASDTSFPGLILVDLDIWNTYNKYVKKFTVYHQLVHCSLGVNDHVTDNIAVIQGKPDQCPISIMTDTPPSNEIAEKCFKDMTYYINDIHTRTGK